MPAESGGIPQGPEHQEPAPEPGGSASQENSAMRAGASRTATLNLPFVTAQFRAPRLQRPHVPTPHIRRQELGAAAQTARSFLPEPKQTLYYAGLAALAATELIEWPVAAAIAVGTAVAGRGGETRSDTWHAPKPSDGDETSGMQNATAPTQGPTQGPG
ncbi:MAG TPA: hypothetical protein VKB75_00420 [Jatrophihabitans sp.]|nr:hypothetical protein [Jatrophihabitans sp.]